MENDNFNWVTFTFSTLAIVISLVALCCVFLIQPEETNVDGIGENKLSIAELEVIVNSIQREINELPDVEVTEDDLDDAWKDLNEKVDDLEHEIEWCAKAVYEEYNPGNVTAFVECLRRI